ncbi:hypothetical protein C7S18_15330 [Ahniella affigens]|uniref:Protein kinase domain-containing protein n=1 Tax=Ahniella affigens TaxID=2021234 RepID=A0A2P1PUF3_9GAMM|nr:serine/threonine-protein kinase [Ahniella affigens]AVP98473.1 hypothetical protein C7S18_15330 [Ahniella affigens]
MNPELMQIFRDALDVAPADLADFLNARCADAADRAKVIALLAELHQDLPAWPPSAAELLQQAANNPAIAQPLPQADLSGQVLGPFRLLRPLGSGGMGAVWLAERIDDFEQNVAIKWAHAAAHSELSRNRFANERQLLGRLSHPGIAHIVDGGTDQGLPWYAMEYVDGQLLDAYLNDHEPSLESRLKLMIAICDAVQHAHRYLVVHRDLKPSNIMVLADGRPKLLDFGIAKHLDEPNALTMSRAPLTFAYAAPEQIRGDAVTTATDVYALGVILYEMLTGVRPHKPKGDGSLSLLQAITDTDARPPSTIDEPRTGGSPIPAARLKGDLDTLVLKALQRDPAQRYGSPEALADDLQRFLDGLPITAQRESWHYRWGKFIRRHKVASAFAGSTVLAVIVGAGVAFYQRDQAIKHASRAEATKNFILSIFTSADAWDTRQDVSAVELTLRGLEQVQTELKDQPEARIELYATIAEALGRRLPTRNALMAGRLLSQELNALPGAPIAQRIDAEIDVADYLSGAEDFPALEQQIARVEQVYANDLTLRDQHRLLYHRMFLANVHGQFAETRALLTQSQSMDRSTLAAEGLDLSKLDCREWAMTVEIDWAQRQDRQAIRDSEALLLVMDRDLRADDLNRGAFLWHVSGTLLRVAPSPPALALVARVSQWTDAQFGANSEYRSRIDFHDLLRLRAEARWPEAEVIYSRWMAEWSYWPEEFVLERQRLQYQGGLIALAQGDGDLARERFEEALELAQIMAAGHSESPTLRAVRAGQAYLAMQADAARRADLEAITQAQLQADDGDWWQSAAWLAEADLKAGRLTSAQALLLDLKAWHQRRGARFDAQLLSLYPKAELPMPAQPGYELADMLILGNKLIADAERIQQARSL